MRLKKEALTGVDGYVASDGQAASLRDPGVDALSSW